MKISAEHIKKLKFLLQSEYDMYSYKIPKAWNALQSSKELFLNHNDQLHVRKHTLNGEILVPLNFRFLTELDRKSS